MVTLNSPKAVQEKVLHWKGKHKIAFVATMGCLHEGHLALIQRARHFADRIIVSIFVNPMQFGPSEDFAKYPRTMAEDVRKLEEAKVDLLFTPDVKDVYPDGFATRVHVEGLSDPLCGKSRPGHFDGVATVCLKLFQITSADIAIFGEKDFQQLRVIQRMTEDLNLPITIISHPIVRETDGLALSSRNRYLSADERKRAASIPQAIQFAQGQLASNSEATVGDLTSAARKFIERGGLQVEYIEIVSSRDLVPASSDRKASSVASPRMLLAVRAGSTRLIDNMALYQEIM